MATGQKPSANGSFNHVEFQTPRAENEPALLLNVLQNDIGRHARLRESSGETVNLIDEIRQGNRLSERGLKQLDHAFDLQKFAAPDPGWQERIDIQRSRTRNLLAENDLTHYLRETGQDRPELPDFEYKGQRFDKALGPQVMRAEQDFFIDRDRWMTPAEVQPLKTELTDVKPSFSGQPASRTFPTMGFSSYDRDPFWLEENGQKFMNPKELERINERQQQIIRESKNPTDRRAVDYFRDSGNKPTGEKSFDPPIPTTRLDTASYLLHGWVGKGQDLKANIKDLKIKQDSALLKDSFLGKGEFQPEKGKENPLPRILEEVRRDGKPRQVTIPQVLLQTEDSNHLEQGYSIGKVKLQAKGTVHKGKNGRLVFSGTLNQGENMEVYTFPKGGRKPDKEGPTKWGRQWPLYNFRTFIEGQRPIYLEF